MSNQNQSDSNDARRVTRRAVLAAVATGALSAQAARWAHAAADAPASPYALSDADLFAGLDYDAYPTLAPVRAEASKQDMAGAKRAFGTYLRGRSDVMRRTPNAPWDQKKAENAVAARVVVVTYAHAFPNGAVDWAYNETVTNPDLPDNPEWQWQLNRMEWWPDLARAYVATGDARWATAWTAQMRSWAAQCPPPPGVRNSGPSSWRTIEAGIRMGYCWPLVFRAFLSAPEFTDEDIVTFVKACAAHGRYLRANQTRGNWLTMEMSGLYSTGALLPELKEAKGWRGFAADTLYADAKEQFLPDGAQVELTPGYHNVALSNYLKLYDLAKSSGHEAELPRDYAKQLEAAFNYDLLLMAPDGRLPRFNDSWPDRVFGARTRMDDATRLFPTRTDFRWAATSGKEGTAPREVSHPFDWAGYFVMRDGWKTDSCYAVLDAGPLGAGHVHQDKLNVVLWAYGREILFDGGGGSYEKSKWRSYDTDTFAHNTILVDGKPQRRSTKNRADGISSAPINARWRSDATSDFAEGIYQQGYGNETDRIATHLRRVLFVKPAGPAGRSLLVVSDRLTPSDATTEHTYQARWHVLPTATQTDPTLKSVTTTDAGQPNLAIVPLLIEGLDVQTVVGQETPEVLGWHIRKDETPQRVPATSTLHTKHGTGERRFLTLLLPLRPGETNPVKSVRALGGGVVGVDVTLADGRVWHIQDGGADGTLSFTVG